MGREKRTCQGKQHFSHPHILKLINQAESETLTGNACEQPSITSNFYGCNTCQYFLHENCLNAPRFLDHSSHPSHHLTLLPTPTYKDRSYTCNACGSAGNGFSFSCTRCDFDIHMQCALLPQIELKIARSMLIDKHPHELELCFGSPCEDKDILFVCDICNIIMDTDESLYYCADCDFGSHLYCASPDADALPRSQQRRNPNPIPNANSTVEMINSINDAHERLIAAQIESQIAARARQAMLDSCASLELVVYLGSRPINPNANSAVSTGDDKFS
ncbi:protein VACUOLELESS GAMETOPHYTES-like [Solanum dulcamara]|uniref:protein VACUOLELESS GAMETOPHYTES-like n=1 Tax=Solanum dulcamara TaxID=45834 RepID=UPI002484D87E|nr:protein VACUOLELESS GAMETOPHYTES-like [Solanum dulcamara]